MPSRKRFWCNRGATYHLADGGYLLDPDSTSTKYLRRDAFSIQEVFQKPCVALLGEPGIGKSTALSASIAEMKAGVEATGDWLLDLDLKEFSTDDRLERHLTESPKFKEWATGTGVLHLFLDSLDECTASIPSVAAMLVRIFIDQRDRIGRLRLGIACRTADWPTQFDNQFPMLWGKDNYSAYELLPLRRCDVVAEATSVNVDSAGFLRAVAEVDAQPLAIKPVTLNFLLRSFKSEGALPNKQVELYRRGCRLLCTEPSDSRRDAGNVGGLDADKRFAIAARIGAVLCISRRPAVCLHPTETMPNSVPLAQLVGGFETSVGVNFEVDEFSIREVLKTGLFSSHGRDLLGFSHQTYAEFLAAEYLVDHKLDVINIASLICHPDDPGHPVVPQLAETTAWLASMNKDVFQQVMRTDPHILLRSDAATADNSERAELVLAFLEQLAQGNQIDSDWSLRSRYGRFSHPGLADQIRPFIVNKNMEVMARRVAIYIAETARATDLQDTFVSVALDDTDDPHIRSLSVLAIAHFGDESRRKQLIALIDKANSTESADELCAYSLGALWPGRLIGLNQVLAAIERPDHTRLGHAYDLFLGHDFVPGLAPNDLPVVLNWLRQHHFHRALNSDLSIGQQRLSDTVILAAWNHLEDEVTRDALADYVIKQIEDQDSILSSMAGDDERAQMDQAVERRRQLTVSLVNRTADFDHKGIFLTHSRFNSLVRRSDLTWLLEKAVEAGLGKAATRFAQLARWVFNVTESRDVDQIVTFAVISSPVQEVFQDWLDPIALDSLTATTLREHHRRWKELNRSPVEPASIEPPMTERVKNLLDEIESGQHDSWWQLNYCMLFESGGRGSGHNDLEDDLRKLPGWKDADQLTRQRILRGAAAYLKMGEPGNEQWLGTDTIHRPAFAGYRALVLLANEDHGVLSSLSSAIWSKWAAIILAFPVSVTCVGKESPALDLVARAYKEAPSETIDALLGLIDHENRRDHIEHLSILEKLQKCWDDRLCNATLAKAHAGLKPGCVGDLLRHLLQQSNVAAKAWAESLVSSPLAAGGIQRQLAHISALMLVQFAADAGWRIVWPAIQADEGFGCELMEKHAWHDHHTGVLASKLSEEQAAQLYIWLERKYPHQDPQFGRVRHIGPKEAASDLRDSMLRALSGRGTWAAVSAIQAIAKEFPQYKWMQYQIVIAKQQALRGTWSPPTPAHILGLAAQPTARLVRSESELQQVVIEAISEINSELQGETPAAPELWNLPTSSVDFTKIRPKDENRLSDWLKLRLEAKLNTRGIIALREVQIRRGEGTAESKTPGERTDLHVTGIAPGLVGGQFEPLRVIVEVKGCWHNELQTAMKSQLVDRYLNDNDCQHGLYIVGWFRCEQWDKEDTRNNSTPPWSISDAQKFFDTQAEELSTGTHVLRAVVLNASLR